MMSKASMSLESLPGWAQTKVVDTAPGLLEDNNATWYLSDEDSNTIIIEAHGWRYETHPNRPYVT